MLEKAKWNANWIIEKYKSEDYDKGLKPYSIEHVPGNILLNSGIVAMWNLVCGLAPTDQFDNTNSRLGVGDSSAGESAEQSALLGSNTTYKNMEPGYPMRVNQTVSFKSVFGPPDANFEWNEYTVDNGTVSLNRRVVSKGMKYNADTWTITLEITLN